MTGEEPDDFLDAPPQDDEDSSDGNILHLEADGIEHVVTEPLDKNVLNKIKVFSRQTCIKVELVARHWGKVLQHQLRSMPLHQWHHQEHKNPSTRKPRHAAALPFGFDVNLWRSDV